MAEIFNVSFESDVNSALDAYAAKISGGVARAGAQAMAQAVYEEAKVLAPVADKPHALGGGRYSKPGTLRDSIYQVYSKDNSGNGKMEYHVSWNRKKAPHGHLVEFGTSKKPASPFLHPAYSHVKTQLADKANAAMNNALGGEYDR